MRTLIVFLLIHLCIATSKGQRVALGTTNPHESAALDITSTTGGLLSPRMTVLERDAIPNPAKGLLVFVTNDSSFYYFDGYWKRLVPAGEIWSLYGNNAAIKGVHFIGTKDSVPLTFKVNDQISGELDILKSNTSLGYQSLISNTAGTNNAAFGSGVLSNNTTGYNNVAIGNNALQYNGIGYSNVAIGNNAMAHNIDNHNIVAVGDSALFSQNIAYIDNSKNTAIGSKTLFSTLYGRTNTAVGFEALYSNFLGNGNTATGVYALYSNATVTTYYSTSGNNNTANGTNALYSNTIGSGNTAVGNAALYSNTTGTRNTALGGLANVSTDILTNATAIGSNALVTSSNKVVIGDNSIEMVIGGYANWSNLSDGRFKENIEANVPGLSFITKLRPVTYTINTQKLDEHTMQLMPAAMKAERMRKPSEYALSKDYIKTGFIAQEVEQVANAIGYTFDGVNRPKNITDTYSLAYGEFVVPLVKAVQEQQKIIEDQNKKIDSLQVQIDELRKLIAPVK